MLTRMLARSPGSISSSLFRSLLDRSFRSVLVVLATRAIPSRTRVTFSNLAVSSCRIVGQKSPRLRPKRQGFRLMSRFRPFPGIRHPYSRSYYIPRDLFRSPRIAFRYRLDRVFAIRSRSRLRSSDSNESRRTMYFENSCSWSCEAKRTNLFNCTASH